MKSSRFYSRRAALIFAAVLVISSFTFSGCKTDTETETETKTVYKYIYALPIESNDALIGSWKHTYESGYVEEYNITQNSFDSGAYGYSGNNLVVDKKDETSGIIYIKYTKSMMDDGSWAYSESAPDVGKWYAISYKELTSSSVQLSGAYKASGKTSCDTLKDAIVEFTEKNGYFGTYSDMAKSE